MRCKVWKRNLLFICAAAMLLVLPSCGNPKKHTVQFFSMDTLMQITAYGDAEDALQKARQRIESLDKILNVANENADVSQIRNGDVIQTDIFIPLQTAKTVSRWTNGALDVTLFPLSNAWGFYSKQYHVPDAETIRSLVQSRGEWSLNGNQLQCSEGVRFDLGSVAKGYAAQCAADLLRENGTASAILALGGNVQTVGQKPNGSDWIVAVADPMHPDGTVGELRVGETAVVTSGSYQRCFTENGKTYHHILDPVTGYPAESGLLSVTVLCKDGTMADALSTALFITGLESIQSLYYSDLEISFETVCVANNQQIYITPGIADRFQVTNEQYASPIVLT